VRQRPEPYDHSRPKPRLYTPTHGTLAPARRAELASFRSRAIAETIVVRTGSPYSPAPGPVHRSASMRAHIHAAVTAWDRRRSAIAGPIEPIVVDATQLSRGVVGAENAAQAIPRQSTYNAESRAPGFACEAERVSSCTPLSLAKVLPGRRVVQALNAPAQVASCRHARAVLPAAVVAAFRPLGRPSGSVSGCSVRWPRHPRLRTACVEQRHP